MTRTALSIQTAGAAGYPATPLTALAAAVTLAAADAANGNSFPHTGREIIIVQNSDSAAHTVTVSSTTDDKNRSGTITAYSIPANGFALLGPFPPSGWRQADGSMYLDVSDATIKFGVVRLPAMT